MGRRTGDFRIYAGSEYSSRTVLRFSDDGASTSIVTDSSAGIRDRPDEDGVRFTSGRYGATTAMELNGGPALYVKCVDGWGDGQEWGGYLQVACAHNNGKWIDSSDGWVKAVSRKADPVRFLDKGDHYEIWQRQSGGRPLTVQPDGRLRFVLGATPGKFNLKD
ncbi:hypothetical protein [Streptomyces sp. AM6-12]|uniref:hypothetical protein n=1 Tax=Streptomyces sp. AM6-12 TaxID=3345149 RepID=UPI0037987D5A